MAPKIAGVGGALFLAVVAALAGCGSGSSGQIAISVAGSVALSTPADVRKLAGTLHIDGDLDIRASSLTTLAGLESLSTIGGHLLITLNDGLTDLTGLSGLTVVSGDVSITSNAGLASASLPSLATVGTELTISENPVLTSFDLPSMATMANGSVHVAKNPALLDVNGFAALRSVSASVDIETNAALTSVDGISSLTVIPGDLIIWENDALPVINLPALTSVGATLQHGAGPFTNDVFISTNGALKTVKMPALRTVGRGGLRVHDNAVLPQCWIDALATQVGQTCQCSGNDGKEPCQ